MRPGQTRCPDEGVLRAYLDRQLPEDRQAALDAHLAGCPACAAALNGLAAQSDFVYRALSGVTVPPPAERAAWSRFMARRATPQHYPLTRRLADMSQILRYRHWRVALSSALLVVALVAVMAIDPVRSAAAHLLGIFRVQHISVIEFNPAQLDRLQGYQDKIMSRPQVNETRPVDVTSADQASRLAGFQVLLPSSPAAPGQPTKFIVQGATDATTQVNLAAARSLLESAGLKSDALPKNGDTLAVTVHVSPVVAVRYGSERSAINIIEARSPEVDVPDGVDMQSLSEAGLRLLGVPAGQAQQLSRTTDWATTLIIPIPKGKFSVTDVQVNGTPAYLVHDESGNEGSVLFWEREGVMYGVQGNRPDAELLGIAQALR